MIIMSKFKKRLSKASRSCDNILVIGSGLGNLEDILEIYKNVFVISEKNPGIKAKNLIYRENFDSLNLLSEINTIIIDLDQIHLLNQVQHVWQRDKSLVIVQGDDPIDRSLSKPLYDSHWGCTSLHGYFHVWEQMK